MNDEDCEKYLDEVFDLDVESVQQILGCGLVHPLEVYDHFGMFLTLMRSPRPGEYGVFAVHHNTERHCLSFQLPVDSSRNMTGPGRIVLESRTKELEEYVIDPCETLELKDRIIECNPDIWERPMSYADPEDGRCQIDHRLLTAGRDLGYIPTADWQATRPLEFGRFRPAKMVERPILCVPDWMDHERAFTTFFCLKLRESAQSRSIEDFASHVEPANAPDPSLRKTMV